MEETFADPNIKHVDNTKTSPVPLRDKAGQLAHDAGARAQQIKDSAVEKAGQFREFAGTKAHDIKETATAKAHDLKETATVKGQQFKEAAGEQIQQGQVKAREAHADAEEYVRQNPTKSILTALGVGFLIGLVVRR